MKHTTLSIIILFISCLLLINSGCGPRNLPDPIIAKHWKWHHVRYNKHYVRDSFGVAISSSADTIVENKTDTIFYSDPRDLRFRDLHYFLRMETDTADSYAHVASHSNYPSCDMNYYFAKDSVYIVMHYAIYQGYIVTDDGVEYWWTL